MVSDASQATAVGDTLSLPKPNLFGKVSVEEAISARRSTRSFTKEDLTPAEVSQLLWAAQGVTATVPRNLRAAPSAGALYPLEVSVLWKNVLWHYLPEVHSVELRASGITRDELADAALGQGALRQAPACFVISAVYSRTEVKYKERAERYVHIEVGHAAENILLEATALGLACVTMGAFNDADVKQLLRLPQDEAPLYLIPTGHRSIR
jgi:SagB-type dehydrogenase family enzyme